MRPSQDVASALPRVEAKFVQTLTTLFPSESMTDFPPLIFAEAQKILDEDRKAEAKKKDAGTVEKLNTALTEDPFHGVRMAASKALREIATEPSFEALVKAKEQDDARVRRQVVGDVGSFYKPGALAFLKKVLAGEKNPSVRSAAINGTGALFVQLLADLERLLATDAAFLLGPWLAAARRLGGGATDCEHTRLDERQPRDCADFMEWSARAQLTTWYLT